MQSKQKTIYEAFEDFVVNFFFRLGLIALPILAVLGVYHCFNWMWNQMDFLASLPY